MVRPDEATPRMPTPRPGAGDTAEATGAGADATSRLEAQRRDGLQLVLKIGAATAGTTMLIDGGVFFQTRNEAYLVFSMLAALVLVTVVYGFVALQAGRVDRAVAVPLVYLLLIAPVGPALVPSRALVSIALPFIAMAVAMNYASQRHLRMYGILSWASGVAVLGLWQINVIDALDIPVSFAVANVVTAAVIVGFAVYALSHYSRRLQGAFDDVRTAHVDLGTAHAELREVDAARVRFMNNAAHELKTPLTPINIQLQLLARSPTVSEEPRARRSVEILTRNFQRLQRLVSDILDGARMDAGRLDVRPVPMDLSTLLEEALEEYERPAEMSGIDLQARVEPDLHVEGDPLRIRQVVDNLLSNALKFTRPGGHVVVEALVVNDEVCVNVHDDGIGVAPQDIHKMFLPFRQVHDPMTHVTSGSGLGLYISRGIVEHHGGRIWGESPGRGAGSTFSFCLPHRATTEAGARPVLPDGAGVERASSGKSMEADDAQPTAPGGPKRA